MPKLLYQGHGSFRLTADIILVTHQHGDHNQVRLCVKKSNCRIITNEEALEGGKHNTFDIDGILIKAVEAKNLMHNPKSLQVAHESPLRCGRI